MVELQKKARGQRPSYFEDPAVDKLMAITLALTGEVAVLRDRIDTIERLSAEGKSISPEAVDAYEPDEKVREIRNALRDTYLDVVLRIVHQEREELEHQLANQPYDDVVTTVSTN
ncbi:MULTISPECIES: hypothetical protein [Sphingobium]|uniref:Uncharacterized protein n=1 Tax=Sphingobium chungbukense TaxID=56193 RepID=A0A0M3AQU9_9SPHN|nr:MULTISPECIES: hypothetical protein [Sphingobium]KKW91291.1 hypothetical protein YP76_17165 [Sphingobium chungbukense]PJG47598.1 hypothetical protein CAF53_04595 [Sphingobium sp. LB126]